MGTIRSDMRGLAPSTLTILLASLAACSTDNDGAGGGGVAPADAVTYQGHLRAVIEKNCVSCHSSDGIGPFALDSYEAVQRVAPAVVDAVKSRRMPPWLAGPGCQDYRDDVSMNDADVGLFQRWFDHGRIEGDPATYVAPATNPLRTNQAQMSVPPTTTLRGAEPYQPNPARPDDYRCFVLPHEFTEETFITASKVVPDKTQLVHHVIVYLVQPEFAEGVVALDAADPDIGYSCFGGVGAGTPRLISGWAPGREERPTASDAAIRIPKGAKLVMQMHYNVLGADPVPDHTEFHMWTTTDKPSLLVHTFPLAHLGIDIPANEPASKHSRVFRNNTDAPWTVVGVAPHMHLLGTKLRATAQHASGDEECLVDIPRWDFGWQGSYLFDNEKAVVIQPGESVRLECQYDNSAANQPVVNGERLDPKRVFWGEGTLDEMCLAFLITVEPYAPLPEPGELCVDFQTCYDACVQQPNQLKTVCAMRCSAADSGACSNCVIRGIIQCGLEDCPLDSAALADCIEGCSTEDDVASCIGSSCTLPILGFDTCVSPSIDAGKCDMGVSACGVERL